MSSNRIYVCDPLVRIFHWSLVLFFTMAYLTEDDFMTLHELAGYIVLGLVGFRVIWGIVGVFASSAIHNENLVKGMITGYKEKKE